MSRVSKRKFTHLLTKEAGAGFDSMLRWVEGRTISTDIAANSRDRPVKGLKNRGVALALFCWGTCR